MIPTIINGKLRGIGRPIVGVMGTSSKQGKFSVQLLLRNYFINHGYNVGQLGTEPSSLLFGFDEVYPFGFESTVKISGLNAIAAINSMMGNIEDKSPDIIIVGSQSQTIPQNTGNLDLYVTYQYEFLYGTEPDAIVLCVNIFDDIEYIKRTISYLESIIHCKVIEIVLFPLNRTFMWGVLGNNAMQVPLDNLLEQKKSLSHSLNKKVYILGEDNENIAKHVEQFFQNPNSIYENQ